MLSSNDLWPREFDCREILDRDLATISTQQLVHHLAKLGTLLFSDPHQARRAKVEDLLHQILPEVWARKSLLWLQTGKRHLALDRKLLLSLIVYVLGAPRTDANSQLTEYPFHKLGEVILRFSSLLLEEQASRSNVQSGEPDARKFQRICADYMAQAFVDANDDFGSVMTRYRKLYFEGFDAANKAHPKQSFDFRARLVQLLGFPMEEANGVLAALRLHYGKPLDQLFGDPREFQVGSTHFRKLSNPDARDRAPKILAAAAGSLDALRLECTDLRGRRGQTSWHVLPLFDRPLLQISEDCFAPLDLDYLVSSLTEGLYWRMLRGVGGPASPEGKTLKRAMGRAVEWYCIELLTQASRADAAFTVMADARDEIPKAEGVPTPDVLVVLPDVVLVIEICTPAMSPSDIFKADPDVVVERMRSIWLGKGPDGGGEANQIFDWVDACRSGKVACAQVTGAQSVVPIVLSLRTLPQGPGLTPWYRQILRDGGAPPWFTEACHFFDIYELELVLALHASGRSVRSVLEGWKSSELREDAFRRYGLKLHSDGPRHPVFERWVNEAFDEIQRTMFPKGDLEE